jgi:cytochrome c oxidase subunit 2
MWEAAWTPAEMGSPFEPSSPYAAAIARVFVITLVVCAFIGLGVTAAIAYALAAFRARRGAPEPAQTTGNRRLEILWTLVPLAIVTWLFVLTLETMARSDPPAERAPDLTVVAHQWWWEVRYPSGAVTANELHIPTERSLLVRLEAADVIHDFWVPRLSRKMDAVPGHPNTFWLRADAPGAYGGTCAEYCGAQHAWMLLRVVAERPPAFDAWQTAVLAPAAAPAGDSARRGERLFGAKACGTCHAIRGGGFDGDVAPDLTHVASRSTLGAGVVENTPQQLEAWLRDPQSAKPGCHMPAYKLTDVELADLLAYLEGMR